MKKKLQTLDEFKKQVKGLIECKNDFVLDDIKQLHNLRLLQHNYHRLAIRNRNFTFVGLVGFFACIAVGIFELILLNLLT